MSWLETIIWVLGITIQIAGFCLIPRAILIARTPQAAIAWAFALAVLPLVTIPLFLIFGESRFSGYEKACRDGSEPLDLAVSKITEPLLTFAAAVPVQWHGAASMAERLTGVPPLSGNRTRLLIDGQQTFDAIFEAIDGASRFLMAQFYIVHDDTLGRAFKDRLIAAARRGVRVYFLYDDVGSKKLPQAYTDELRREGILAASFITNRKLGTRFQINFRNHRKLVVADGRVGFVGGLNVGDEYMGRDKRFGPWRDTHMRVEGPAAQALCASFLEDWKYATDEVIDNLPMQPESLPGGSPCFLIPEGPADDISVAQAVYLEAIAAAQRRVWIATPYFIPPQPLRFALQTAALRGVDVRVLLPGMADHILPWYSAFTYYPAMRVAGVKLYRHGRGFMHQKVLLADDDFSIVGSINLDYRSMLLNFELGMAVCDVEFARTVEKMFETDFAVSRQEDPRRYEDASVWFRLQCRLAALMSPEQ